MAQDQTAAPRRTIREMRNALRDELDELITSQHLDGTPFDAEHFDIHEYAAAVAAVRDLTEAISNMHALYWAPDPGTAARVQLEDRGTLVAALWQALQDDGMSTAAADHICNLLRAL